MLTRKLFFTFLLIFPAFDTYAQRADTVYLTLPDAENLFLQKNYQLLAAKYHVDAAEAGILNARLWENPTVSVEQSAYNPTTHHWFDTGKQGETAVSAEQLITLGRKRHHRIEIEKLNTGIATAQFYDLIRTLRFELRTTFWELHHLQQSMAVYDQEIEAVHTLIQAYTIQLKEGNIPFRELARLQALLFGLENERLAMRKDAGEKQSSLRLLIADTTGRPVRPVVRDLSFVPDMSALPLAGIMDTALTKRYDYQSALETVHLNQENLALQKAVRVPDVSLSARWDKQGGFINNYNAISLQASIPLWNRNQGNIRQARSQIDESTQQLYQMEGTIRKDVTDAYAYLTETDSLYRSASGQFTEAYDKMLEGITRGYQTRTISMLEFIDYFETYKNSKIEYFRLHQQLIEAVENLNLATGKIWFNN